MSDTVNKLRKGPTSKVGKGEGGMMILGAEFARQVKMLNFTFGKFTVAQSEFAKHFL